ncbi:hypothetical protein C7M84_000953 [Penaeus vannamei]|uniref:Uncharacterized protein n=1 Tax=Penaeus vannamei TaxID=6689 RepID=A0A423TV10_PENVA|nr:hypothetical protein C7M84_000953 [Penaeus vannamei]
MILTFAFSFPRPPPHPTPSLPPLTLAYPLYRIRCASFPAPFTPLPTSARPPTTGSWLLREGILAVPTLPDGHKKFQFYLLDESGQAGAGMAHDPGEGIQDLLIRVGPIFRTEGEASSPPTDSPQDSIHQVIASVQQVISEEVAHTQRLPLAPLPSRTPLGPSNSSHNDTSFLAAQANGESIDIPEAILHNLMSHPYFTTSWLTQVPTTRPEETTTNPWMLGGEDLDGDVGEVVEEVTEALEVGEGFTEAATSTRSGVFDSQGEGVTESAVTEAALLEEFVVTESATAEVVLPEEADLKASSDSGETKDNSQTTQSYSIDETTTAGIPARASDSTSSSETTLRAHAEASPRPLEFPLPRLDRLPRPRRPDDRCHSQRRPGACRRLQLQPRRPFGNGESCER